MKDVCILFVYHRDDFTTRHNYSILKKNNNDADIHALVWDPTSAPFLPDTTDVTTVAKRAVRRPEEKKPPYYWANCDLPIYDFFLNHPEQYQRYVYIEADTVCNISVRELYGENWNDDLVSKRALTYEQHAQSWDHFKRMDQQTADYFRLLLGLNNLAGIAPLCGTLMSVRCLHEVVNYVRSRPGLFFAMFCEMRLATAARLRGIEPVVCRRLADSPLFDWFTIPFQDMMIREPGIYHGVKSIRPEDVSDF